MRHRADQRELVAQAQPAATTPVAQAAAAAPAAQVIEVKGIRASLESAVSVKRNSLAVVDAISAEDVGKLPDSDVGEAIAAASNPTCAGRATWRPPPSYRNASARR